MLRATQILPHTRYSDTEARTYCSLGAHARHVMSFKLMPASTLEITLSQFWSSLGEGTLDVEVAFHGVAVVQGSGVIAGPSRSAKVQIRYVCCWALQKCKDPDWYVCGHRCFESLS